MKKASLLFHVTFLLFALVVNGQNEATDENEGLTSDKDENIKKDSVMEELEDAVVPPPLAMYPLNENYTTEDLQRRPEIKGTASNILLTSGPHNESNGAYQFNGNANSYIEFPNGKGADGERTLDAKKSITLMCWVRPGDKDGPLFNYAKNAWGVHIWIALSGRFFIRVTKKDSHGFYDYVATDGPLEVGKWVHVAATYNFKTGINSIYVDGVLKNTKNIGTGPQISTNDPQVRMGAREGDGRYFNGAIAQMGVWNVALTPAQILAVRNKALPNPCDSSPCNNGGSCIKTGDGFRCICRPEFTGPNCAQEINECENIPCQNEGICTRINSVGSYQCVCAPGFEGKYCTKDINECDNSPCQNGATCTNTRGSYQCKCASGFNGKNCDQDINECDNSPCQNGATCTNNHGSYQCKCAPGFNGKYCGQDINECDNSPCQNGATCTNTHGSYQCKCAQGFNGKNCDQDINECAHYNGGCQDICVNTVGNFYCACSDPEFSVAPDKRHCTAEGVELDCGQNDMTIILPKSLLVGLDREHLILIDVNCKASENGTHYFLKTNLTGCKTILRRRGDFWIYSNMVSEIPIKQHQIVTRVRNAMIPFHCFYSKWGVVSSVGLKPSSKKIILSSKGFGKFTITLDLFRKYDFQNPFSQEDFPVMFTIRERIYAEVRVDTEDDRLTILALDCYTTPSQDRNSQPRYDVIKDGCAVDDTLKFHPRPDPQSQRFSLEAFQYVSKHPYVFLHCKVQICNATDDNSRCAQGCVERRRRSVKTLPETADNVYPLAQGPLTLNRDKREAEADEALESDQSMRVAKSSAQLPFVVAMAVVIAVCVVGMSYMAWQKKRGKAARQYKPLYIDTQT